MTDFRALCEELNGLLEYISDISPHLCEDEINNLTNSARAALAEQPVGPRMVYHYSSVTIAECGGPCEQGPQYCDCGEIKGEPVPESVGPTDDELWAVGDEDFRANYYPTDAIKFARAVLARWGQS